MKRWLAGIGFGLLVAALIGAFVLWWRHTYERVETEVELPPTGEAVYNPLYGLRLALSEDGVEAVSRPRLRLDSVELGARDTVLMLGDPRLLTPGEIERLLDWAAGGGHLLVPAPVGSSAGSPRAWDLLPQLGIELMPDAGRCMEFLVPDEDHHIEFCSGNRILPADGEPLLAWGDDDDGFVFLRTAWGDGHVDVLSDLDFLRNDKLEDGPHIALTRQLLDPNWGRGRMHLVYSAEVPSLWRLLLEHAWMAWLPLLLALLAWLWMRMQRFGPALPPPPGERRALLEHVQASGEHLRRFGYPERLHGAVRDAFLARLRRRDPVAAALGGRARAEAVAARTGLSAADIEHALLPPRPRDDRDLYQRIARLIDMGKRL